MRLIDEILKIEFEINEGFVDILKIKINVKVLIKVIFDCWLKMKEVEIEKEVYKI